MFVSVMLGSSTVELLVAGIASDGRTAATAADMDTVDINRRLLKGLELAMILFDINCRGRNAFPKLH
jgi:hypothetical protein